MSLREPAWRTPSRPCPFYQRGNCIFAAKCNFLHTLPQNKAGVEQDVKTLHKHKGSLDYDDRPPILRVDSPASIRSPPREPQMQRLLSALTEVIGDEEEEEQETLTEQDDPGAWSSGLPTLVHGSDATFFARVNDTMAELMQMTDGEEPTNDEEDEDDISEPVDNEPGDSIQHIPSSSAPEDLPEPPSIHTTPTSPDAQYVEIPPPPLPENHDDLLSPVEMSALLLNNFSLEEDTFSIDSGFEETWKPPTVFASTFDLLRSPFGSPSNRILSPRIGALPAPSSPLKQPEQSSTLADDLDSPSNRISASVVVENRESPLSECEPTPVNRSSLAYMLSPESIPVEDGVGDSDPDSSDISESYGHTSVWEPTDLETSIYIGATNEGPVAAEIVEELDRQDTESTGDQLVKEGVSAGADEKVRTSKRDTMSSDGLHEEVTESIPSPLVTAQVVEVVEPQEVESEGEETQAEGTGVDVEGEAVEDRDVQDNLVDLDKTPSQPSERLHKSADLDKTPSLPRDERLETPTFDIASSVQEVPWSALSPSQDAQEVDDVVDACIDLDKTPSQPREGQLQTSTQDIVPSVLNEFDFSNPSPPRGEHLETPIHDIVPSALDAYIDHRTSSPPREELQTSTRDIIPLDDLIESIEHSTPSPSLDDQIQHSVPSPFMDAEEVEEGGDMPLGLDSSLSLPQELEEDQSLEAALPLPNAVEVVTGMSLERTLSLPQEIEAVEGSSDTTPSLLHDAEAIVGRTMEEDRTLSLSQEEWAEEKFPESPLMNGDMPHPSTLSKADDIPVPAEPPISTSPEPVADSPASQLAYASEDDSISFLDYLQPEAEQPIQDGDTLNSLYDVYTDIDETVSPIQQSSTASLRRHSPTESTRPLRERVFTPPSASPVRRQAFSSPSFSSPSSSPVTSVDSVSKGRVSPASVASSSKTSHHNGGEDMESEESSKKVPFGFRPQSHPARPSLILNQGRSLSRLGRSPIDDDKPLTPPPSSACSTGALRPLRLSVLLNNQSNSIQSLSNVNNYPQPHSATASLSSVPSRNSSLASHSLSSGPATANPYRSSTSSSHIIDSTLRPLRSPSLLTDDLQHLATFGSPISAPAAAQPHPSWPSALHEIRSASRLSEPIYEQEHEGENNEDADLDDTYRRKDSRDEPIRRSILESPHRHHHQSPNPYSRRSSHVPHQPRTAPGSRSESIAREPLHSIATPKPTLMFAIASDDVSEVRRVLESGDANPNDTVGPQSALQFALTNDQLTNKLNIVKTLLAFGADPAHLKGLPGGASGSRSGSRAGNLQDRREEGSAGGGSAAEAGALAKTLMDEMDPATRYFVKRADAAHTRKTSKLIHRSFFRPLTRVRYDLVGQDRALEELFKLLSIHSRQISVTPVVVMFSGPSGHGKSLLARKFGSLLDVPTHTVNMVTVRSQDDLWESYSINIHEEPTNCTLAEFLVNNEGKRCVVVLDEIEKVDNEKVLWSLLMPWESGRCSFEAKSRHVDTRNVIWLCTSNIGQDLVFNHWAARENQEEMLSREEFLELVALLRPTVSERLGASVLSRMTSVLPFVPFTPDEKRALCAEAIYQLGGEDAQALSRDTVDELIESSLGQYIPEEGARSLHRAVSNQLVDVI